MSHVQNSPNSPPPAGLPPVAPPTAGFLVRLFVVPAVIVAIGVGAAFLFHLTFGWLLGSPVTAEQYLARFDDANTEVRWRAAADLSQRLPRDDRLASDPDFALGVVRRLEKTRADTKAAEAELALHFPPLTPEQLDQLGDDGWLKRQNDVNREAKKLDADRTYIKMLTACLGHFMVPVGVPVLRDMALQESGAESSHLLQLRANALWSLAVLGENCQRFDKLTPVERQIVLDRLQTAATDDSEHADTIRAARAYLQTRQDTPAPPEPLHKQVPDTLGVDAVVAKCATDEDPFLRELSAFALNFWYGDAAANKKMEQTLDLLAHDDGRGTLTLERRRAQARRTLKTDFPSKTISYSIPPELTIKLNATTALARRGSELVSAGRLAEMLDQNKLRSQFVTEDVTKEKPEPDEASVVQIVVRALEAVRELHAARPEKVTPELRAAVDGLKNDANSAIKNEAAKTALALSK